MSTHVHLSSSLLYADTLWCRCFCFSLKQWYDSPPSLRFGGVVILCPSLRFGLSKPPSPARQTLRVWLAAPFPRQTALTVFGDMVMSTDKQPNKGGRPTNAEQAHKRRELNARQRAYVLWAATPEVAREPKSESEFAEVLGVTRQSIWKWSKDPRVIEAIRFVALQEAGNPVKVRAIVDMVYEVAMAKRDPKLAEVWMKATGVFSQFGRTGDFLEIPDDLEADSFENYSLEELQRLRDEAAAASLEAVTVELAQRKLASSGDTESAPESV